MADTKLKVLHIFPEFKRGGAQINVLRFIKESHNDFTHYAIGGEFNEGLRKEYEAWVEELILNDMTSLSWKSLQALVKVIKRIKPDIVHVNGKGAALYGFLSSFFTGKPYKIYHTMRGFHIKFSGLKLWAYLKFEYLAALRGDANIMVSPSEKALLKEYIPKIPEHKLVLIPNGIDSYPETLPSKISETCQKFNKNVVTLSRLSHQKDLISMIESFEIVNQSQDSIALHIMGGETPQDKEYADEVKNRINISPVKDQIFLWGSVEGAGNLISNFDLYWTTALFEGLPTAVVEAALGKTLIVATNCVGNVDVIRDGETGLMCPMSDVPAIAQSCLRGIELSNTHEGQVMIDQAFIEAQDYSVQNNVEKIKKLYLG